MDLGTIKSGDKSMPGSSKHAYYSILTLVAVTVGCGTAESIDTEAEAIIPTYERPLCGVASAGPDLKPHLTEADQEYFDRFRALDPTTLPERYDLSDLLELDASMIGYMLEQVDVSELERDALIARGDMGHAVLLALGTDPKPTQVDYRELRRGLYHFYNCDRQYPARLEDFKKVIVDYTTWPSTIIENSDPKIYPRKLHRNPELGIYVAETLRDGEIHETEILLDGYRQDGALEFLAYMPDGSIASRGEFRAGASFVVGASPHSCMSCHREPGSNNYTVIDPIMGEPH